MNEMQEKYPLIYGVANPTLRELCEPVGKITPEIKKFGECLIKLMYEYEGVGIAAPQVGKTIRMAAFVQFDTSKRKRKIIQEDVMINPRLLSQSKVLEIAEEGCLSLPGVGGDVARPDAITVEYTNLNGETIIHTAKGYNARIILHEIDHLDGILFVDKLVD